MAEPYQPQLGVSGQTDFGAAPQDIGAPIANALEYGGELIDKDIHQYKERQRDIEATQAAVQLARTSTQLDEAAINARENAGPGGAGHTQNVSQLVDDQSAQALGSIKDPHLRELYTQRYAELRNQVVTREYGWEAGQRATYIATNAKETGDTYARAAFSNPDATTLPGQMQGITDLWSSLSGVDDATKHQGIKEGQRDIALNFARGLIQKDPTLLVGDGTDAKPNYLKDPRFNQFLEAGDLHTLQDEADTEQHKREIEARQQFTFGKAAASEQLALDRKQSASGVTLPDDRLQQDIQLAKQYGLGSDEWDVAEIQDQQQINKTYASATPPTLHAAINDLSAKVANNTATPAEQAHLKNLKAFADQQIALFNSDPFGFEAKAGHPAPDLGDLSNPDQAKIQARVQWAQSVAKADGLVFVPYLSNDEKKTLTDAIKTGPAGQFGVAVTLRKAFGGSIAADVAQQIDPTNKDLKLQVGFNDRAAHLFQRGIDALDKGTVHLGSKDQQAGQADRDAMDAALAKYYGAIPADMRGAFKTAVNYVLAGKALESGDYQPSGDDLLNGLNFAAQAVGGRNGSIGDWNAPGGLAVWPRTTDEKRERYIWLPPNMSSNDALTKLSRAGKDDWIRAAGGQVPYYRGGDGKLTPVTDSQFSQMKTYTLDIQPDPDTGRSAPGVWTPIDGGGHHFVRKDGKPWTFDVRKLR